MSLADLLNKQPSDAPLKQVIDGQLMWHRSILHKWEKNEDYRILTSKGKTRLKKSLTKSGFKTKFQIDEDGTIYDGNNRFEVSSELISEGAIEAENGKSLEWIPVEVHRVPQSEAEALQIAVEGNGDKDFAIWNKDAVANHEDLFKSINDYDSMVFDFDDSVTFSDVFETYEVDEPTEEQPQEAKHSDECETCNSYHNAGHQPVVNNG